MRYLFPLNPKNQQRQFEKMTWVYPAHLAMYATYLRNTGEEVFWDAKNYAKDLPYFPFGATDAAYAHIYQKYLIETDDKIIIPFEKLPYPDRKFTDALNPRWQSYGNYKFHPATHMMASNLCWYGKCTFCIDTAKLEAGEGRGLRTVDHCMEEIDDLIANGYKEVFDDSGTFPIGKWLEEFCVKMRINGRYKKIKIGCNMKPLLKVDYKMMAQSGFRFILVGLESANQITLDKIKKGQKAEEAIEAIKQMAAAGLEPHITGMCAYPWEQWEDEKNTIDLYHYLLRKGYAKTAQVSIYSPPRTAPKPDSIGHQRLPLFYDVYKSPEFIYRKLSDIKRWEDATYLFRGARLVAEEKWRKFCLLRSQ